MESLDLSPVFFCALCGEEVLPARGKLNGVNILYGINTVTEALKSRGRNFEWVGVAKERKDIRLRRVID